MALSGGAITQTLATARSLTIGREARHAFSLLETAEAEQEAALRGAAAEGGAGHTDSIGGTAPALNLAPAAVLAIFSGAGGALSAANHSEISAFAPLHAAWASLAVRAGAVAAPPFFT